MYLSRSTEKAAIPDNGSRKTLLFALLLLLAALVCVSFALGRYPVSVSDLFRFLLYQITGRANMLSEDTVTVIAKIRFPRILAAVITGAGLSVSGASYQGIFRNPMVSPDILGASAGAAFGAAIGILLSLPTAGVQLASFLCGIFAVGVSYILSSVVSRGEAGTLILVLSGMVVSAFFSALISAVKYVADPLSKLPEITFWLMGGFSTVKASGLISAALPMLISCAVLMLVRWRLNALAFGDEEAAALGVDTKRLRLLVIVCSTLITSSVVSIGGVIGWVGLVIPHLGRMLVGPNYKYLMPASFLIGASYLLLVDNIARNLLRIEIPLGILTAIIGAPFFIYLLLKGRKGWISA